MQQFGYPVIMDVTHSLQQPNQTSGVTGGLPTLIETIAKAAIAVGADGLFIETHPEPSKAKSDGANIGSNTGSGWKLKLESRELKIVIQKMDN